MLNLAKYYMFIDIKYIKQIGVFATAFASTFLLLFGVITLILMVWPVMATTLEKIDYNPQLPVAKERTEADVDDKQLYPPLSIEKIQDTKEGNFIRIPSIGAVVPLVLSPSINDEDVLTTLNDGAALYPNGVLPGRLGNVFISAHSTGEPWKGKYRFAFLKINELTKDNQIHLDYQGARYTYRIFKREIVDPKEGLEIVSSRPMPTVTVMACWPLWSTSKRMLVIGELTNITQLNIN
jgi:LPXTG-site transpeptidase (sortase) family protein